MANNVENRIVQMIFDNAKFEAGIAQSLASIGKIDGALRKLGAVNGFADLQKSLDQLNFAKANTGVNSFKAGVENAIKPLETLRGKFNFGQAAQQGFGAAETASNNVRFAGANRAAGDVKRSISSIGPSANQSFAQVENAAARTTLGGLSSNVANVGQSFGLLQGVASVALGNIAAKAVSTGAQLLSSLSLGPVIQGFQEYGTNLNSIQTILANTNGSSLQDVNGALNELNTYSDKTIYNFSEMAKNIGTFTAAGVGLKESTESIKGIANLAALSGSNSQQASTAMYQLSQAIAAGRVSLQDWNSVVNAGMGGQVFQKALFNTAKTMGTLVGVPVGETFEEWQKKGNSFRESLSQTQKAAADGTDELADAQKEGAKAVQKAQESAADAIEAAQQRVQDAQKGVADATKQGAEDVKNAVKEQQDTIKSSAESVTQAFQQVKDARKALLEAMKPPSKDELSAAADKLTTAQLDQTDLADAVTKAQDEQKRSAEDLAAAQNKLSQLKATGGSADEILSAQRAVEDAQNRVTDAADAQTRALIAQRDAARGVKEAQQDLNDTKKKGSKSDQNVKDAQDALTVALDNYKDARVKAQDDISAAEKRVAKATTDSAQRQKDAQDQLAEAQKNQVKVTQDSQDAIASAHEAAAKRVAAVKEKLGMGDVGGPPSWLTSKVLTTTLSQFTGDMTKAQLKAKGFNDEQIASIQATAKTAQKSATEIKTLGALFDTTKEQIGSGWAQTFQLIFGDFGQAKGLFTGVSNEIGKFIKRNASARNEVLREWQKMGGRTELIAGLKDAFAGLASILKPVREGFRDIFPKKTGADLAALSKRFHDFAETIKIGPDTADKLRRTFAGLFAVLDIGKQFLSGAISGFGKLFSLLSGKGKVGILDFTAGLGDFLVSLDKAIERGDVFGKFFRGLAQISATGIKAIKGGLRAILSLFDGVAGIDTKGIDAAFDGIGTKLGSLQGPIDKINEGFDKLKHAVQIVFSKVKEVFAGVGTAVADAFKDVNFDDFLRVVNVALLGGLVLILKKFTTALGKPFHSLSDLLQNLGDGIDDEGGVIGNIRKSFGALTGTLETMQSNLQAGTLQKIAIAIGLLTASVVALSLIDTAKLGKAMTALAAAFSQLLIAMGILTKIAGSGGFLAVPIIATSMIALATAVDVLVLAIAAMARIDLGNLAKGLGGTAVAMGILVTAAGPLSRLGPGLISAGVGVTALAVALRIMASAVAAFGALNLGDLAKGLGAVAATLTIVGVAAGRFPSGLALIGTQLILVATGLRVMATTIEKFGNMDISTIAKGIAATAVALLAIGRAMLAFPKGLLIQGTGLIAVSIGLRGIAKAIQTMGGFSIGTIAKGLGTLAGSLGVLAGGLKLMTGAFGGAAALTAAAIAVRILAPALERLGQLSIGEIVTGLVALGGALGAIGLAATLLAPVSPALLALSAALLALGVAVGAAATGMGVFTAGLAALTVAGPAGLAILGAAIYKVISTIVEFARQIALGIVAGVRVLIANVPTFVAAAGAIIGGIYLALKTNLPKVVAIFGELVTGAIQAIRQNAPRIISAGFELLLKFLSGLYNNIGRVTTTVAQIVTRFIGAVTARIGGVIAAGANLLVKFVGGITANIPKIVTAVTSMITTFLTSVASKVPSVIAAGTRIITNFLKGIGNAATQVVNAGVTAIVRFIRGIAQAIPRLVRAGVDGIIQMLRGMTKELHNGDKIAEIVDAAIDLGIAIVEGLAKGLAGLPKKLLEKLYNPVKSIFGAAKGFLGIKSPSRKFIWIGEMIVAGFGKGLSDSTGVITKSASDMAKSAVSGAQEHLRSAESIFDGVVDVDPTITPVIDLTNVKAGAKQISDMTNVVPITAAASFNAAAAASAEKQNVDAANADANAQNGSTTFEFKQENTSPKALDEKDIYRQTTNGLSQFKRAIDEHRGKKAG